jgi:putative RecB family exonuclease
MSKIEKLWLDCFNECIGSEEQRHGTSAIDWRAGGRKSKEWPDKENGDWWAKKGPEMLEQFTKTWKASGWQVWETPEGIPAIELELNINYGDVRIKAFVDLIAVTPDGELVIVDWKTGANMPSNSMQLGLYATSVEKQFGLRPAAGFYYNARAGVFEQAPHFDNWTYPLFTELFRQFELSVQNEVFLPNLGMMCKSCSVSDYCHANGGEFAPMMDPLYAISQQKEEN